MSKTTITGKEAKLIVSLLEREINFLHKAIKYNKEKGLYYLVERDENKTIEYVSCLEKFKKQN